MPLQTHRISPRGRGLRVEPGSGRRPERFPADVTHLIADMQQSGRFLADPRIHSPGPFEPGQSFCSTSCSVSYRLCWVDAACGSPCVSLEVGPRSSQSPRSEPRRASLKGPRARPQADTTKGDGDGQQPRSLGVARGVCPRRMPEGSLSSTPAARQACPQRSCRTLLRPPLTRPRPVPTRPSLLLAASRPVSCERNTRDLKPSTATSRPTTSSQSVLAVASPRPWHPSPFVCVAP